MTTWTATARTTEWTSIEDPRFVFRFVASATIEGDSLPDIEEGDAGKALVVNEAETGVEWGTVEGSGAVDSVNGQTGVVVLDASDVGAATSAQGELADSAVQPGALAAVATSGSYNDLSDTPSGSAPIVVQGIIAPDTDLSGGSFTTVSLVTHEGTALTSIPRAFAVGVAVAAMTGDDAGVWTITESGPATPVTVLGGDVVRWVFEGTDPDSAVILVGSNASGPNGTVDPTAAATSLKLPVGATPTVSYVNLSDAPSRFVPFVYAVHDGAQNMDGVDDFLEVDSEAQVIADNSLYHGAPVYRPKTSTIDGLTAEGTQTVIALANQATSAHNGIWELFSDQHGVTGDFCLRTINWHDLARTDETMLSGTRFGVSGGDLYGGTWWETVGNGMDANVQPVKIRAEDTLIVDPGTGVLDGCETVAEALAAINGAPSGNGAVSVIYGQGIGTIRDATALAAEASLLNTSPTLPAFAEGDLLFFQAWVSLLNNSVNARVYTFRVKIGATTVATFVSSNTNSSATTRQILLVFSARVNAGNDLQGGLASICSTTSLLGAESAMASEAVSSPGLSFDLTLQSNNGTSTQEGRLRSIYVWKVEA